MDCGVDSAGDSSVQAFEEDSGVDSTVGLDFFTVFWGRSRICSFFMVVVQ